ncbi:MAG: type II and III secretion system protein [Gammaproteobacteria bacterium]|nr:type II and III secretion system protein [Gammaproteobacteria bacterium]
MNKLLPIFILTGIIFGCAEMMPEPMEPSAGHLPATPQVSQADIPDIVEQTTLLPEPEAVVEAEKYTVVVNEVPVKELLFALARDAEINIDIHPQITGVVTINAVDQTLQQILDRISRQVDLRYEFNANNLIISPDTVYVKTYNVGYLNLSRDTIGTVTVSTQIASGSSGAGEGGAGGGNTSTTNINSESNHQFWANLQNSITSIVADPTSTTVQTDAVVINPESGIVTVRATDSQHQQIQQLIDKIIESVQRQVLIQATVVEVDLTDQFQAGIDWELMDINGHGFNITSSLLGGAPGLAGPPNTSSSLVLDYVAPQGDGEQISAAISMLQEFGDTRVLSSPQIMVLNNHTAVLKVVENFVYFEVEQEIEPSNAIGGQATVATTTTARTVPVGLVMTVTPQISGDDSVTFNVRPTISSVVRTELDPNPALITPNRIPVIRVREMESILRVNTNQIAVLGGLMQDTIRNSDKQTPFAGDIPIFGNLFKAQARESLKTELVIFLRPVVINNASIDGELRDYRQYLEYTSPTESGNTGNLGQ